MKARFFALFLIPVAIIASCTREKPEVPVDDPEVIEEPAGSVWHITIQASKGADTKGLDLINDGSRLNSYWRISEKVTVYKNGTLLGTLDVTPDSGEKPTTATLSGNITTDGLSENDELTLMIPVENWNYTGQTGILTSIEDNYDYASATVSVSGIEGTSVTTTGASFTNEQSVYRFGFKLNGDYFDPQDFTVSSTNGSIVTGRTLSGGVWQSAFGSLSVSPASAPSDHFYYVAIRNESTAADTYNFSVHASNGTLYMGSQSIPNRVLEVPGKFISAKNVAVSQPSFAPAGGTVSNSSDVL